MVMADARMRVRWLQPREGGRATIPIGLDYRATARLTDDPIFWSVKLLMATASEPDTDGVQTVDIVFLIRDELGTLLQAGAHVSVTEGQRVVAEGEIVDVCG